MNLLVGKTLKEWNLPFKINSEQLLVELLEDLHKWRLHLVIRDFGPCQAENPVHWLVSEVIRDGGRDAEGLVQVDEVTAKAEDVRSQITADTSFAVTDGEWLSVRRVGRRGLRGVAVLLVSRVGISFAVRPPTRAVDHPEVRAARVEYYGEDLV